MTNILENYAADQWVRSTEALPVRSALTGDIVAQAGSAGLDFAAMLAHARTVGGPALRAMTFHDRARMLKALAQAIMARKEELYTVSATTGATRGDSWIDIEGGAGTLFTMSAKGRRELPDDVILIDGKTHRRHQGLRFDTSHVGEMSGRRPLRRPLAHCDDDGTERAS